jgi:hypothetical protein
MAIQSRWFGNQRMTVSDAWTAPGRAAVKLALTLRIVAKNDGLNPR